jgi:adenylate cyclase
MLRLKIFGRFRAEDGLGSELPIKSKKARALLAYLALPPGKPRSREELMALLWSERGDEQARGSLRQALSGLRRDLGDDLAKVLSVADDAISLDSDNVAVEPAAPGDELLEGLHINDPAFDEWLRDARLRLEDEPAAESGPEPPVVPDKPTVAILPFVNMSGDPEQEYFSDGITEDIITELSRFRSLFVIARNSSFAFKGQAVEVADIGRKLGVQYIVEGSVRKAGERIRITAQLVEATSGNHLWAERYDRDLSGIFEIQDEVAAAIVTAVPGRIDIAGEFRSERKPTKELNAYELVLKSEMEFFKDWTSPKIQQYLEEALEIDPEYARVHARLANLYSYNVFIRPTDTSRWPDLARIHAEKAVALDPLDPIVHAALADAYLLIGDHDPARWHTDRAIALNPNDFSVMIHAGLALGYLGDHEAALNWMRVAVERDPYGSHAVREVYFDACYLAGMYEDAIEQVRGWTNPPPHIHAELAAAYAMLDQMEDALAAAENYRKLSPEGWENVEIRRAHCRMCVLPDDARRWREGYTKAGIPV